MRYTQLHQAHSSIRTTQLISLKRKEILWDSMVQLNIPVEVKHLTQPLTSLRNREKRSPNDGTTLLIVLCLLFHNVQFWWSPGVYERARQSHIILLHFNWKGRFWLEYSTVWKLLLKNLMWVGFNINCILLLLCMCLVTIDQCEDGLEWNIFVNWWNKTSLKVIVYYCFILICQSACNTIDFVTRIW